MSDYGPAMRNQSKPTVYFHLPWICYCIFWICNCIFTFPELGIDMCFEWKRNLSAADNILNWTWTCPIDYGAATTCHNLPELTTTCCGEMWWVVVSCGKPTTTYHTNWHLVVVSCGNHNSPQLEPTICHNSPQSIHILPQLNHTLPQITTTHATTHHNSFMIYYNSDRFHRYYYYEWCI